VDFFSLIEQRYSVRAYSRQEVEDQKLERLLTAAQLAPTAANYQPFRLIVLKTAGREADLRRVYDRDWFVQAPLVIAVCTVTSEAWVRRDGKRYGDVDATIAMDHLILAAAAQGLGTCWVAAFDPDAARSVLGVPEGVEPLAFTPLGYPADRLPAKPRKPLSDLVRYERW
jgi:nitroreductase